MSISLAGALSDLYRLAGDYVDVVAFALLALWCAWFMYILVGANDDWPNKKPPRVSQRAGGRLKRNNY